MRLGLMLIPHRPIWRRFLRTWTALTRRLPKSPLIRSPTSLSLLLNCKTKYFYSPKTLPKSPSTRTNSSAPWRTMLSRQMFLTGLSMPCATTQCKRDKFDSDFVSIGLDSIWIMETLLTLCLIPVVIVSLKGFKQLSFARYVSDKYAHF